MSLCVDVRSPARLAPAQALDRKPRANPQAVVFASAFPHCLNRRHSRMIKKQALPKLNPARESPDAASLFAARIRYNKPEQRNLRGLLRALPPACSALARVLRSGAARRARAADRRAGRAAAPARRRRHREAITLADKRTLAYTATAGTLPLLRPDRREDRRGVLHRLCREGRRRARTPPGHLRVQRRAGRGVGLSASRPRRPAHRRLRPAGQRRRGREARSTIRTPGSPSPTS